MQEKDTVKIPVPPQAERVACDGGGAAGHPKVWYAFDGKDEAVCGYCDRVFTRRGTA